MDKLIYSKYSNDREVGKNIYTNIVEVDGKREVRKFPDGNGDIDYIKSMQAKYELINVLFQGTRFEANLCEMHDKYCSFEYIEGLTLEEILDGVVASNNQEAFFDLLETFRSELLKVVYNQPEQGKSSSLIFGDFEFPQDMHIVDMMNLDMVFSNVMISRDKWVVIDYEWTIQEKMPIEYIYWRAIFYYIMRMPVSGWMTATEIYERLGICSTHLKLFENMERTFQKYTKGTRDSNHDLLQEYNRYNTVYLGEICGEYTTTIQVYWGNYGKFCEENSKKFNFHCADARYQIQLSFPEGIDEILVRFGGESCFVVVDELVVWDLEGNRILIEESYNGFEVQERGILFNTSDPNLRVVVEEEKAVRLSLACRIDRVPEEFANIYIESYEAACKKIEKQYVIQCEDKDERMRKVDEALQTREARLWEVENAYNAILQSRSWKITEKMRRMAGKFRENIWITRFVKGARYLRAYGVKPTFARMLKREKFRIVKLPEVSLGVPEEIKEGQSDAMIHIPEIDNINKSIAVHIHLFYVDLLGEFVGYLNHIPYEFDLFISCQEGTNVSYVKKFARCIKCVNNVEVQIVPNRGRDVAPLFVAFADKIRKYDYFMHAHSKKSFYSGEEKVSWRRYSLNSIVGSEDIVRKIFWMLENEEIGLVYPDDHFEVPSFAYSWLSNVAEGRKLLERMGIPMDQGIFSYPLGSFYWAKTDAVRQLFEIQLNLEDFPEEARQTDGTLAHAIERALGIVSRYNGYHSVLLDYEEGIARKDFSLKPFRTYLSQNADTLFDTLYSYDVVSFDIFDTLVTRCIYNPDDLFRYMENILCKRYGKSFEGYFDIRKKAEEEVWIQKDAATNIDDIYIRIGERLNLTKDQMTYCRELEVQLEYELIVPRLEMQKVFERLKKYNKTIILVSDMYLKADIIQKILGKCGYTGYDRLYISCECGRRKDRGDIWQLVYQDYPDKNIIHVGDNMQSDCQVLCDQQRAYSWIASAKDELMLSHRQLITLEQKNDIMNSLPLGLTFNKCIFNSPFALGKNAQTEFSDSYDMGFSIFGPLFYDFTLWIDETYPQNAYLAFLAREGYLLKKVYDLIHKVKGDEGKDNCYFLASRRAVTVAGIRNDDDLKGVIGIPFVGNTNDLFQERFGLDVSGILENRNLKIGLDNDEKESQKLIDELGEAKAILYHEIHREREAYLEYMGQAVPKERWDDLVVVDVGYSGTIQYYLARLLQDRVDGAYLATFGRTKPDKIGCKCPAMYDVTGEFYHEIERTQLFLEAVLQAPYGQLVRFEKKQNGVEGVFKAAPVVSKSIRRLQKGILDYCKTRAQYARALEINETYDNIITQTIYKEYLNGWHMTKKLASIFEVEDGYCSSNYLTFNKEKNTWNY